MYWLCIAFLHSSELWTDSEEINLGWFPFHVPNVFRLSSSTSINQPRMGTSQQPQRRRTGAFQWAFHSPALQCDNAERKQLKNNVPFITTESRAFQHIDSSKTWRDILQTNKKSLNISTEKLIYVEPLFSARNRMLPFPCCKYLPNSSDKMSNVTTWTSSGSYQYIIWHFGCADWALQCAMLLEPLRSEWTINLPCTC